jgi:dipeptidyl aminopeptidase/acylaminoacyl peptidase
VLYVHHEVAWVQALSKDEALIAIGHSEHGDSRHPAVQILDTQGQVVRELWDGPGYGLWATAWSPLAGDPRLLVQHQRYDMAAPLIWNVATGEVGEIKTALPGEVEAAWYADALALLLRHSYRGRSELYRCDLQQYRLERLVTEPGMIAAAQVRPGGEVWYTWSRSSTPTQVRANGRVLFQPPGEPAPGGVAYTDHLVDGIHVFLAEPASPRPHPTIFRIHGGPASHDTDAFSPRVQAWVDHGFAVVLVNYRGSSGYGKTWRDALEGNPGFTELADLARVHDWVTRAGIADPRRTILSGQSWGGYLTLLGLGCQPERWSLGIAGVPVADYTAAYADEMEPLKALDRALFKGAPADIPEVYRARSPITYADRLRVPVLILAGENDPRCPMRQIDNYLARLRELGKPHEVYRYDAGHGSLVIAETLRQLALEMAFAAKHLGTSWPQ